MLPSFRHLSADAFRRVHSARTPARLATALAILAIVVAACSEYPTQPKMHEGEPEAGPGAGPSPAMGTIPADAPDAFSASLGVLNGETIHPASVVSVMPSGFTVWYTVTGSGILDGEWEPHPVGVVFSGQPQDIGVTGVLQGWECVGAVKINSSGFRGGCGYPPIQPDTFWLSDSVRVSRMAGPWGKNFSAPVGSSWGCTYRNCTFYTGTQTIAFTRINAVLRLRPTPYGAPTATLPATVRWGSWAHFYAERVPDLNNRLPFSVRGWEWTPDPTSIPRKTTDCTWSANPCTPWLKESGTLRVTGYVNGKTQQAEHHVEVLRRKLQVKPEVQFVRLGDTARFTAAVDTAGGTISGMKWLVSGDTTGLFKASTCRTSTAMTCYDVPNRSYTRIAEATVDDSLQRPDADVVLVQNFEVKPTRQARLGDTVVFKAYVNGEVRPIARWRWSNDAQDDAACAGDSICARVIQVPGVDSMTGYLNLPGQGPEIKAHGVVTVPPPVLTLEASKTTAAAGEIVAFTLYTDGVKTPADSWQFVPDSASEHTAACAAGVAECEKVMRSSGTMIASRTIAGANYSDSEHVSVTGDCAQSASASSGVSFSLVGQPCGSTTTPPGGTEGGGPPKKRLTVIRHGAVAEAAAGTHPALSVAGAHNASSTLSTGSTAMSLPATGDTIAVFAHDSGTVKHYALTPGVGYKNLLVLVDDTAAATTTEGIASGTFVMDNDRTIQVVAEYDYRADVRVMPYIARIESLVRANNKPEAYRDLLEWYLNASDAEPERSDSSMGAALFEVLGRHQSKDALIGLDDALGNESWEVSYTNNAYSVVLLTDEVLAMRATMSVGAAQAVDSRPQIFVFINGIHNTLEDAVAGGREVSRMLKESRLREAQAPKAVHFHNRNFRKQIAEMPGPEYCAFYYAATSNYLHQLSRLWDVARCRVDHYPVKWARVAVEWDVAEAYSAILRKQGGLALTRVPEDAQRLATSMDRYRSTPQPHDVITIAHSQGNLIYDDAIEIMASQLNGGSLQQPACMAHLTLASPIPRATFSSLAAENLAGLIANGDLLLQLDELYPLIGLENDFERIDTKASGRVAAIPRIRESEAVRLYYGKEAHGVHQNYFVEKRTVTTNRIVSLAGLCRAQ